MKPYSNFSEALSSWASHETMFSDMFVLLCMWTAMSPLLSPYAALFSYPELCGVSLDLPGYATHCLREAFIVDSYVILPS